MRWPQSRISRRVDAQQDGQDSRRQRPVAREFGAVRIRAVAYGCAGLARAAVLQQPASDSA